MKTCTKCRLDLPFEAFHRSRTAKDGLQSQCRECKIARSKTSEAKAVQKKYQQSPAGKAVAAKCRNKPERKARRSEQVLLHQFNITPEQLGSLHKAGDGRCWKCNRELPITAVYIDRHGPHVRGLLCRRCCELFMAAHDAINPKMVERYLNDRTAVSILGARHRVPITWGD
jgi:hypothetical protein